MTLQDLLLSYNQIRTEEDQEGFPISEYSPVSRSIVVEETPQETTTQEATSTPVGIAVPTATQTVRRTPSMSRIAWTEAMKKAYKKAGITSETAIKMLIAQDALESGWGSKAQGLYNYGNITTGSGWKGSYVNGHDHDTNGNSISAKFRSYDSIDDYVQDKLSLLKRLYDFKESDNIDQFVKKLTGNNKGKRKYAVAKNYAQSLKDVFNRSFRLGGILKAGDGATLNPKEKQMRDWLQDLGNAYKQVGTPESLITYLLAQDAYESGWGTKTIGNYNYGNFHAGDSWDGDTIRGIDHDSKGRPYEVDFRSYKDSVDYARDKWKKMVSLYELDEDDTYDEFLNKIEGGNSGGWKYAENPQYRKNLNDMITSVKKRLPKGGWSTQQIEQVPINSSQTPNNNSQTRYYNGVFNNGTIPGLSIISTLSSALFQKTQQ